MEQKSPRGPELAKGGSKTSTLNRANSSISPTPSGESLEHTSRSQTLLSKFFSSSENEPGKDLEKERREKTQTGEKKKLFTFFRRSSMEDHSKKRSLKKKDYIVEGPERQIPLIVSSPEELPPIMQRLIHESQISREKQLQYFTTLLSVLSFMTKKKLRTPEQDKALRESKSERVKPESVDGCTPQAEEGQVVDDEEENEMEMKARAEGEHPYFDFLALGEKTLNREGNPKKLYRFVQKSGKGGFGTVFEAKESKPSRKVAIKRMQNTSVKEKRTNLKEVGALTYFKHPNIVDMYAAFEYKEEIWVAMEFLPGGTLTEAVKLHEFDENQIAFVSREMLKALSYLHGLHVMHRDLKSANVMMTIDANIKLIDFGLCIDVEVGKTCRMAGSPWWMAPEVISRVPYGTPVDIWSFAVCILELANHHPPHSRSKLHQMFTVATEGLAKTFEKPQLWTDEFKDFIGLCLKLNPLERATANQLLEHRFLKKAAPPVEMKSVLTTIFIRSALEWTAL